MASPAEPEKCEYGYRCVYEGDCTHYKCSSCSHLLKEPSTTSCCSKVYCKAFLERKKKCPNCQSDLHPAYNRFLHTFLQDLEVLCSEKEHGCPWKGKVREFEEHITHCEYVKVSCEECHQAISKNQLETHRTQDCPLRQSTCPHCQMTSSHRNIESHVCQYNMGRIDHLNNEGHVRPVDCPFSPMGCRAKLQRDEEEHHLQERTTSHLSSLASYVLQLDAKLTKTVEEFKKKMEKKTSDLEGDISSLTHDIDILSKTVNNQPENDISPPESQAEPYRVGIDLESKLEEKDALIQQLKQSLDACKEQQAKLEQRMLKIETSPKASPRQQRADCLEDTITVEGFTEKKQNHDYSSTPIFKNHREIQHNLILCVWPNGQKEGKNTHVALWLQQEVTPQPNPPAHIFLYVEIINQLVDDYHIRLPCQFPIEHKLYIGEISNTAVSHANLDYNPTKGTQFLVNDTLKIRIRAYVINLQPPFWS